MSRSHDNQWPRYQVFHQPRPDKPHVNAGSVHAPDAELALQNARDVFVRRPECVSLWVVRADHIHSLTKEQHASDPSPERRRQFNGPQSKASSDAAGPGAPAGSPDASAPSESPEPYLVFHKRTQIGSHEHAGEVQARTPTEALTLATEHEAERRPLVWWVVRKRLVVASEPDQGDSMFGPARTKDYRGQAAFPTTTMMRKVRQQGGE